MQMSHNQRLTLKPYPDSFLLFLLHSSKLSIVLCLQLHQKESNQSRDRCGERICLNTGEARVDDRVPIVLNCIHGAERCDQGATTERFGTESARSLVTERRQRGLTKVGTECSMWGGQRIDRDKNASWEKKSSALTTFHPDETSHRGLKSIQPPFHRYIHVSKPHVYYLY